MADLTRSTGPEYEFLQELNDAINLEIGARRIATDDQISKVIMSPFLYTRFRSALALESGMGVNQLDVTGVSINGVPVEPVVDDDLLHREQEEAWKVIAE